MAAFLFQHTAARRRLGPKHLQASSANQLFCFNTQPPEGGWLFTKRFRESHRVSTHSRPKAAGTGSSDETPETIVSTHSRPKAAGINIWNRFSILNKFQHTAARRRLVPAADLHEQISRFNTQPPEGGWILDRHGLSPLHVSTHSRPKAAGASRSSDLA